MKKNIHLIIKKKVLFQNNETIEADFKVPAIINDNGLKFIEPDKTKTTITFDNSKIIVERKNDNYSKIEFDEKHDTIYIMKTNSSYSLQLNVTTLQLYFNNDNLKIVYQTEVDKDNKELHEFYINFL